MVIIMFRLFCCLPLCLVALQVIWDPKRKGILVDLGEDCSKELLEPKLNLLASTLHRHGLKVLIWRPHDDFASQLPDGITCPCCKAHSLSVHELVTRNVRRVMGRDRTILMIGCTYICHFCAGVLWCCSSSGHCCTARCSSLWNMGPSSSSSTSSILLCTA